MEAIRRCEKRAKKEGIESPARLTLRRLRKSPSARAGLGILLAIILLTLLAPVISPYNPTKMSPTEAFQAPSGRHLMGTDDFGRDVATRVLFGARISLAIGLIAVALGGTIGATLGLIAGYVGGKFDFILMRIVDIMLAVPGILLAMVIMAILGPSLTNVMIAVGLSDIPMYVRLVRGCVLSAKENNYVEAARALGCPRRKIILKHILPNIIAPLIVYSTLEVANAILTSAALSFLGMGAQPPTPEWGSMLSEGRRYIRSAWWLITFPGLMIVLSVLGINLMGDGLRDALDPKLKRR